MKILYTDWKKFCGIGLLLILITASCNKKLDLQSTRIADEEGHWSSYENARSGIIGLYGLTRAALAQNNTHWICGELRQGDFKSLQRSDLNAVISGKLNAGYPLLQQVSNWRSFYAAINACNLFIERVSGCLNDIRYTEAYYNLDVAQARALRAFLYFYMVRIWGDIPFSTSSGEGGNFDAMSITGKDAILTFATSELKEVAGKLPYLYSTIDPDQIFPSNYYNESADYWANAPLTRLAAYALLAHIAAWQGNYIDASIYTEVVANNYTKSNLDYVPVSTLVSPSGFFAGGTNNYRQLIGFNFTKERGETTVDGHIENLTLANTNSFYMSKKLPDIYVDKSTIGNLFPSTNGNDDRFGYDFQYTPALLYTTYFENYNAEIPVFKKIRVVDGGVNTGQFAVFNSSIVFTRLEEILLLRAEAFAALGREADARNLLNTLRGKRSIDPVSPLLSGSQLIDEIFRERRRELMGEGWRWYDVVREKKLLNNDPTFNAMVKNGGIYWPIAQEVLSRNNKIEQNNYWK
ncbi:RagB/SusD family nutrient uptake outer membrane protein [Niabella pedocola]|uniref:RagB/SusD family nutrient uptake outer membrane protein n=1 Tax=Niabella pedocola TaxID=1752077 RepID=A0ABS8PXK4_9BACT|nr:RagB/SusD family nutrient uptake outer membrane protein [Niabella pedocola]MCD2424656.1 RagB/SusD family nutrient uptake outer membrane protein [Niabella pedocola]